jgi:hypothetical protein
MKRPTCQQIEPVVLNIFKLTALLAENIEQGKYRLTNEYLFLIDCWYYEKNILFWKKQPIQAGTHS